MYLCDLRHCISHSSVIIHSDMLVTLICIRHVIWFAKPYECIIPYIPTRSIKVSVCLCAYYNFHSILVFCVCSEFAISFESLLQSWMN